MTHNQRGPGAGPREGREHVEPDERMAEVAEGQDGAVSLEQMRQAGLSVEQIGRRVRSRRILPTAARAVYRLPGSPRSWRQDLWVAVLANPSALVSHTSAAALFGLHEPPAVPHITVGRAASGRKAGAVTHHAEVGGVDRCRTGGVPGTCVARTIVDDPGSTREGRSRPRRSGTGGSVGSVHRWGAPGGRSPRAWAADDIRQARIEALGWRVERADRFDLRPSSTRLKALLVGLLRQSA